MLFYIRNFYYFAYRHNGAADKVLAFEAEDPGSNPHQVMKKKKKKKKLKKNKYMFNILL